MRAPFWAYQPLRPAARRIVIILAAVALILDSLFRATSGGPGNIISAAITTSITLSVALFAWRPPVAAIVLVVAALLAGVTGIADSLLAGAAILGLVAFSCSGLLTAVYFVAWLVWLVAVVWRPDSVFQPLGGLIVAILSVVSLMIGLAIRQQYERAQSLALQLEVSEREVAEQLKHERDLIADELHDIVAHEITIVALHAAAERTSAPVPPAPATDGIRELTASEMLSAQDAGATLLDVREPWETQGGIVAGSVLIPLGDLLDDPDRVEDDRVVVICAHGVRARHAAEVLRARGVAADILVGGLAAWQQA